MSQYPKRPFKDRTFYLDLRSYRNQDELIKNLKKLGGKVESFLSRDINYVITDKPLASLKSDSWKPSTPKSLCDSPLHLHDHFLSYDSGSNYGPLFSDTRSPILSRGLALIQKAKTKNTGGTDVVQICNQWNIKLLHIQQLLSVIDKYRYLHKQWRNDENQTPTQHSTVSDRVEKLATQYVKVEACSRLYRPQYKNFVNWKTCVDEGLLKLVDTLQSERLKTKPRPLGEHQSFNINAQALSTPKPIFQIPQPKQMSKILSQSKTIPLHYLKEASKGTKEKSTKPSRSHSKKKSSKRGYCEICSCSFVTIEEHLQCKSHKTFQRDSSKYKKVANVISSLPDLAHFMDAHKRTPAAETSTTAKIELLQPGYSKDNVCCDDLDGTELYDCENDILPASCCSDKSESEFRYLEGTVDARDCSQEITDSYKTGDSPLPTVRVNNLFSRSKCGVSNTNYETPPITPDTGFTIPSNPVARQNLKSKTLFDLQDIADNKLEVSEALHRYTTDFPYDASVINGRVLRKFPFTNFGFGWKSSREKKTPPCNETQVDDAGTVPVESLCNFNEDAFCVDEETCMEKIAVNACMNFEAIEERALDLSMIRPGDDGTIPVLEGGQM